MTPRIPNCNTRRLGRAALGPLRSFGFASLRRPDAYGAVESRRGRRNFEVQLHTAATTKEFLVLQLEVDRTPQRREIGGRCAWCDYDAEREMSCAKADEVLRKNERFGKGVLVYYTFLSRLVT